MEFMSLSNNVDNSFKHTTKDLLEVLKSIDRNYNRLSYFNAERVLLIDSDKFNRRFYLAIREFRKEIEKALLPKKCIVFGETSAGKSALLNKIMNDELLPSSQGRTSKCFVHIRRSLKDRYFVDQNDKVYNMDMWDEYITSESNDGSSVDVFMDKWPFDCGDITLIDSPGLNESDKMDENIVNRCRESSLIILVVDSIKAINKTLKEFIEKYKSEFTKLNILFVINKADKIKLNKKEELKNQHLTDVKNILESLGYPETETKDRTFFLSSKDKPKSPFYEEDNKEFDEFLKKIKLILEDKKMKIDLEEQMYKFVIEEFDKVTSTKEEIEKKISLIMSQSEKRTQKIKIISGDMKKKISSICKRQFDKFENKSFKNVSIKITDEDKKNEKEDENSELIRSDPSDTELNDINSSKTNTKDGEQNMETEIKARNIKNLLNKGINNILETTCKDFKDLIKKQKDNYLKDQLDKYIRDNEYFPFDCQPVIFTCYDDFAKKIMEIGDKKFKAKIGTIAGTATGLAVAAGTAGVAIAILCPIAFGALAIAGIGAGAAATGTVVGGGVSGGIISLVKEPFKFIQNKDFKSIKEDFEAFEDELYKCYESFLSNANKNLLDAFKPLQVEYNKIQFDKINKERKMLLELCN